MYVHVCMSKCLYMTTAAGPWAPACHMSAAVRPADMPLRCARADHVLLSFAALHQLWRPLRHTGAPPAETPVHQLQDWTQLPTTCKHAL